MGAPGAQSAHRSRASASFVMATIRARASIAKAMAQARATAGSTAKNARTASALHVATNLFQSHGGGVRVKVER
eukprot:3028576-Alexandrium_andersonii.AAC.1